jgi:hypothetical protein
VTPLLPRKKDVEARVLKTIEFELTDPTTDKVIAIHVRQEFTNGDKTFKETRLIAGVS